MSQRVEWVASPPVAWGALVSDGAPPSIVTSSIASATVGSSASVTIAAVGTAPLVFSLSAGTLPTGRSLSAAGVMSGTYSAAGTFAFTVQAANAFGTATQAFTQTVTVAGTAPTITTTTLPAGAVGTAYSQTVAATGDATITRTLYAGALPAGLSMSTAGVIGGTPTAAGTATFTVRATNSVGSDDQVLTLTIAGAATTQIASPWARWIQR
jgi:hypothetical protein